MSCRSVWPFDQAPCMLDTHTLLFAEMQAERMKLTLQLHTQNLVLLHFPAGLCTVVGVYLCLREKLHFFLLIHSLVFGNTDPRSIHSPPRMFDHCYALTLAEPRRRAQL